MASTVPYVKNTTWADGSGGGTPITAAKLNTIEQGLADAHQMPSVRVSHNTTQSVGGAGIHVALAFNTERFDTVGAAGSTMHDTVTNNTRLTCRYAGKYLIIANALWASNPTTALIELRLNGSTVIGQSYVAANYMNMQVTTIYDLAVNDYVEVLVAQTSGSAVNISNSSNHSPEFMMTRVA